MERKTGMLARTLKDKEKNMPCGPLGAPADIAQAAAIMEEEPERNSRTPRREPVLDALGAGLKAKHAWSSAQ